MAALNNPASAQADDATSASASGKSVAADRLDKKSLEFLMFVTGSTAANNAIIQRFRHFCAERFTPDWVLEVVDLRDTPDRASRHNILVTPSVVMRRNGQSRRVVGDFGDEPALLRALGFKEPATSNYNADRATKT